MQIGLNLRPIAEVRADALVLPAFEDGPPRLDLPVQGWIDDLYATGEFTGERFALARLHHGEGLRARRLVLAGCGKRADFDAAQLRLVSAAAVRSLKSKAIKRIALVPEPSVNGAAAVRAAVEGALLGAYEPDRYRTDPKKEDARLEGFAVVVPGGANDELEQGLWRGRLVAEAQNWARELAAEPGNRLTPTALAEAAQAMADKRGLACEILDRERMRQLGMGALLGVAQGSAEPPFLIVVRYRPEGAPASAPHLGLLGKGVTFDTGGISLKPSEKMEQMRYDMSGGAAVLAAMRAIAELAPPAPVTALVPAVENMPGPRAQRPGDIVTTLSGKTVEVLNTDAEGRLILADAITYARRLGCTHLVDLATLTGAIVVALGHVYTGAFGNSQAWLDRVLAAARAAGEKIWPMPLDEEYLEPLKTPFADLANVGPRAAGAITASRFLREFADPVPWVHLDIAGTAWLEENKPFMPKGPTGVGVRTLVELALAPDGASAVETR
jgi:leucyl aminopeptidase